MGSADAAAAMLDEAIRQLARFSSSNHELDAYCRLPEPVQQAAVDLLFASSVESLFHAHWTPLDLHEVLLRRAPKAAVTHLPDVAAEVTARYPAHLVHPQWQGQLDLIGAVRRPSGRSPASAWAGRVGLEWPAARARLLTVLAVLSFLPTLTPMLPAPGTTSGHTGTVQDVDEKVLRRVRGLLAKAESTEHPDEADAFNAKAQELMARYSIERAMAESTQSSASEPVCRRLWLVNPYFDAKASLVSAVARANNCRAVQTPEWGFVAVIGHPADLDAVDLLATGLLVQATQALASTGPQVSRSGASQTRSFRRAFLLSYARRIGERLTESARETANAYDTTHAGALVPVLTARRQAVEDKVLQLYPDLVSRRVSISNASGWGAGRAAADLARLDVRNTITRAG